MCRRAICRTCSRITYAGCGMHVEQVLAGVPAANRCACDKATRQTGGWLGRLFRRS
ncbi:hypothetical protein [Kitasatospora paranensis]|uniref:Uncharacterized protein n=1 Tax=Kitasatospora paranensis TaxID=258053 RepID=A0ABW2FY39_9ACTN